MVDGLGETPNWNGSSFRESARSAEIRPCRVHVRHTRFRACGVARGGGGGGGGVGGRPDARRLSTIRIGDKLSGVQRRDFRVKLAGGNK